MGLDRHVEFFLLLPEGFALGTFIGEFVEKQVQLLYENSTFIALFSPKIRMICSLNGDKADGSHCTQFPGACALMQILNICFCCCAEKTSFRFDPAYPRPTSASTDAWKFQRCSRK
jgi:hypothetical protein